MNQNTNKSETQLIKIKSEVFDITVTMTTFESIYMPDEWTATTTELLISVSTDSDLYMQKGKATLNCQKSTDLASKRNIILF